MIGKQIDYSTATTSEHSKLLKAILSRVRMSESSVSDHHDRWRRTEQYYMMYKRKTKKDLEAGNKKAEGEGDFESYVMPYSYAQLLTAHTYMVNVFLNRSPVFPVESNNGDGAEKELTMESLLQYQVRSGKMEPQLLVWLLDPLRYGVGFLGNYWAEDMIPLTEYVDEEVITDGVPTGEVEQVLKRSLVPGYQGNKTFNILPYDILPDPRVSFSSLQDGEFFGRKLKLSYGDYKRRLSAGWYFNDEEVGKSGYFGSATEDDQRSIFTQSKDEGANTEAPDGTVIGNADAIEMYVDLVPSQWGLGDSDYPEKWVFTVLNKKLIIGCSPLGLLHNRFPFHVLESEVDGYKQESRGLLEIAAPMNDVMTWLFNSHMYNKRQVMNNQFVVDPSRIMVRDMQSKTPGKLIRAKATAYGQDVRSAIMQLPVSDVTGQNYQDLQVVNSQMQETLGINGDVAGNSSQSSRRSATEFRGTTGFSANRLANMAYHFSVTGFRSLGNCLISSSQQMYSVEMKVKVAGDNVKGAQSITVSPEDIAGEFDISAIDGNMPLDRMAQAQFWMQVLQMTGTDPELQMQYRRRDIFSYMSKLAGLKNIDKFKIDLVSDEEIVAMVKQGLLQGAGNGGQQQPGVQDPGGQTGIPTAGAEGTQGAGGMPGLAQLLQGGG